jgi:Zn-dependent protease
VNQTPDFVLIAISILIVLVSLTVHEVAHAWTAEKLGDPTARQLGRISFNPIVHIDPIGTLLLPAISAFTGLPLFGWAKPVPVNMRYLRHPYRDFAIIAAAGPISNFLQAALLAMVVRVAFDSSDTDLVPRVLRYAVLTNLTLAIFNLIPVPPLDGGNVLAGLLPPRLADVFVSIRPFGFIILYALMFTGVLSDILWPPVEFLVRLML